MYDEAIHCLRKALKSDNGDVVAYWELADIYKARNNPAQALQSLGRILKLDPVSAHDFTLLADFVPLYRTTKAQKQNGIKALRVAWQYHLDTFDGPRDTGVVAPGDLAAAAGEGEGADGMASDGGDGDEDDDEGGGDDDEEGDQTGARPTPQRPNNTMRMDHVLTFVDLLLEMDQLEEALDVIKRGQRWLQGRYRQAAGQWEGTEMEDDREYDPPGFERPGVEADDRSGKGKGKGRKKKGKSAKKEHGGDEQEDDEDGEDEEEGEEGRVKRWPLMPNFRHRLALIRLRLGHVEEANVSTR
jgi:general transcription factor 3C polypeptide 3 (transcription factor C subunit 4)